MRKCKIDMSLNRAEYEDLRLNKKLTYSEIAQIAKNKNDEILSIASLSRHFTNCIQPYLDSRIKSDKLRERFVKEKLQEHISASINIVNSINALNEQLVTLSSKTGDPESRKEIRDIIRVLDSVLQTALRYKDEIKPVEDNKDTNVYDRLLWSLEQSNIPIEYIKTIKDKWEEYKE